MGAIGNEIWAVPAYLPYVQPELTDDAIAEAEEAIGFRLPREYIDLLRIQNGGYIRLTLPDSVHDTIAGIGPHFPSLTDIDWEECQEYVSHPLTGLVPFDGDGHWYLCFDYRKNKSAPSITYVDVECDSQEPIAPTFQQYLSLLKLEVEDELVVFSVGNIESLKSQLSSLLLARFDSTDDWDHGYTEHFAMLGGSKDHQWLRLSANIVPRGFARTYEPRYEELKDRMPGEALQYPELPPNAYILTMAEDARERVLDACTRCRLTVKRLDECLGVT